MDQMILMLNENNKNNLSFTSPKIKTGKNRNSNKSGLISIHLRAEWPISPISRLQTKSEIIIPTRKITTVYGTLIDSRDKK